jgi:hypothetical protein
MTGQANTGMPPAALSAADPRRRLITRAIAVALLAAGGFAAWAYAVKMIPRLDLRTPWEDDPYDVATSFVIFFVPLVVGCCALRALLCRPSRPLPLRRAHDLLRACRVALAAAMVTLASDWLSVILRENRRAWNGTTTILITELTLLTALAAAAGWQLRRAFAAAAGPNAAMHGIAGPDWLADALALAEWACDWLGPAGPRLARAVRWLDSRVMPSVRRHLLGTAMLAATGFAAVLTAAQSIGEGYRWRAAALFFCVWFCGMFALITGAGSYLRLAGAGERARGAQRRLIDAGVLACASVPVTLAFRDAAFRIAGARPGAVTIPRLALLLLAGAAAAFAVTFAAESAARAHPKGNT